jgi:ATP-binding cassette, subfamily A (ABC1), member 3
MSWAKFKLLLDKNITIQKRHVIGGLFEILFPICLSIILAYVRDVTKLRTDPEYHFDEFSLPPFEECVKDYGVNLTTLAYSPGHNPDLNSLMEKAIPNKIELQRFLNSEKLNEFLHNQTDFLAGIVFDDALAVR